MVNTLPYIQKQAYEGMKATYKKKDGTALDISTLTECVFRIFKQDFTGVEFFGSFTVGEVTFLTNGTDGVVVFTPDVGDMSNYGLFKGEVETTLGGKPLKKQDFLVDIKRESPTS
jgi:hypothetical protein